MEQKAKLYENSWCTSLTTVFSRWTGVYGFKVYRNWNVLETITRFQRQFSNQRTPCRQTIMDNYNKYIQYGLGLSLNKNVGNSGRPRPAWTLALARRSKFSDTARNPAKQRSISSAVLRSLMSVGNATDKAEWRRTYGQIPLFVRPP